MNSFTKLLRDFTTDYKINSDSILGAAIFSTLLLYSGLLIGDLLFDLRATSPFLLLPSLSFNTLLITGFLLDKQKRLLSHAWILLLYITIEGHILINPQSFFVLHFWFIFVPMGALLVKGVRASQVWLLLSLLSIIGNVFFVYTDLGALYNVPIKPTAFLVAGFIFLLSVYSTSYLMFKLMGDAYLSMKQKSEELEKASAVIDSKKNQLEKYQNILFKLSKDQSVTSGNMDQLFEKICRLAVEHLEVSRVSIWSYNEVTPSIERKYLFEVSGGTDEQVILEKRHFPKYFEAILNKSFVAVDEARTHPITSEFTEVYLKPLNIFSMLDCPVTIDGEFMGVICCENQQHVKHWSPEEILFVQSLSDIIALAVKAHQINQLMKKIRSQNHELLEKNNEIDTLNEELTSSNEELITMNESLEMAVRERTKELEQQNIQLTEYAFINSHILRAPLSRILGLANLIADHKEEAPDPVLLKALTQSVNELDAITRKIAELLYHGSDFSRDEVKEIIDRNLRNKDI